MKKLLTAIAGLSLLATPLAAAAQSHTHTGSGHTTARPNVSRAPGWDRGRTYTGRPGGYYRGYAPRYYRDRDYGYALGGLGLGLAAGALLSEPAYGYDYGYYGPSYYSGPCGRWMWDRYAGRYVWDAYVC